MAAPRLGIILDQDAGLRPGKSSDPVDFVLLRSCFVNLPRASGARALAKRIHGLHPDAELIPFAWHYLTHESGDGAFDRGTRTLDGDPRAYGHLRETPEVAQAWTAVESCADGLGARRLVLHTPPSFSPGSTSRSRLKSFVRAHAAHQFVWQPSGLWSTAEALAIGLPLGVEVLDAALPASGKLDADAEGSWILVNGERDGRMSPAQAEILADTLCERLEEDPAAEFHIAFGGHRAYGNMRTFAKEWARSAPPGST
jgi:hypothetical protein